MQKMKEEKIFTVFVGPFLNFNCNVTALEYFPICVNKIVSIAPQN
jgi:hypothetical protein